MIEQAFDDVEKRLGRFEKVAVAAAAKPCYGGLLGQVMRKRR
jgi:hypothetical protein